MIILKTYTNISMKKQNLFSSLLISTVALSIALPSLVNADPSGTPPGGNVDATFNSVNAGYGTTAPSVGGDFQGEDAGVQAVATGAAGYSGIFVGTNGMYSEATSASGMAGGFYNFASAPAVGVLMGYAGDALLASGPTQLIGRIYSGSTDATDKYVNIEDTDGVRFGNDAGTIGLQVAGTGAISNPNGNVLVQDSLYLDRTAADGRDISIDGNVFGVMSGPGNPEFLFLSLIDAFGGIGSRNSGVDSSPLAIVDDSGMSVGNAAGTVGLTIAANGNISNILGTNPVKFTDDNGVQFANTAGTVGLTVSSTGALSNNDAATVIDDDNIYTSCTSLGKSMYLSGATAYCKKAVALTNAGLDVPGSIINSAANFPVVLSDADGVLMSGTGDGLFWVRPNGTTGTVSLANENGNTIVFNGADNVVVGSTSTGLQIDSSGNIQKLGSGAVPVNDANGMSVTGSGGSSVDLDVSGRIRTGGTGGYGGVWVENDGSKSLFMGENSGSIGFWNNSWALNVNTSGNVGIGNNSPSSKLDVTGQIRASSIGTYYTRSSSDAHRAGGAWVGCDSTTSGGYACNLRADCDGSDRVVDVYSSWMVNATANGHIQFIYNGDTYGAIYFYDDGANDPDHYMVSVKCFAADGIPG